jgi:hypothetical protein
MSNTNQAPRRAWVRIPLTLFLVWFAAKSIGQGWNTFTSDNDWSDDYIESTATIVGAREQLVSSPTDRSSAYYRCHPIVEFSHDGETYKEEPIWLEDETYSQKRGDYCAAERLGEAIRVWMVVSAAEPYILEPENRSSKPLTGIFNIFVGLLALLGVERLWFAGRYGRIAGE